MKQTFVDKYNVAWFKLAECVSRGEKERALGVYRLLSYSINDPALRAQLEGDLLLSFNDSSATEKYCKAVDLYQKEGKLLQAAAVYEHVLTLEPDVERHRRDIIALYKQLNTLPKVEHHTQELMAQLIKEKKIDAAEKLLDGLTDTTAACLHEQLVFAHIDAQSPRETVEEHITKAIKGLLKHDVLRQAQDERLQQFMAKLQAFDPRYHTFAQECMKKGDDK